jgi:hypothetical protein
MTIMDIAEFWKLIDKTKEAAHGDSQKQSDLLTDELVTLPEKEIISFEEVFEDLKDKAYIGNLWDAATLIMYGSGDDGFQVFREWLIGRGKEAYESAIKDPETPVNVLEVGEQIYPTLLSPALDAYEKVTGKNMPPNPRAWPELQGRPTINIDADEAELLAELSTRFPKLTAKFWEWWTRDRIFLEVREILREILLPLEFIEEGIKEFGGVKFKRVPLLIALLLDYYVPDYTLYVSRIAYEGKLHPADILIHFLPREYNEDLKVSIPTLLRQWLRASET